MENGLTRPESKRFRRLVLVLGLLFGLLAARLIQLQVIQGPRYSRLSDRNRIREILLPAPRGRILDRDGEVVAETRPSFTCTVIPTELSDSTLPLLSRLLELPLADLEERIRPVARYTAPISVKRTLTPAEVARVEENNFRLSGVHLRVDPIRSYPNGTPYSHLLGHIGEVSEDELKRDTALRRLDYIGRSGVEAEYEDALRGRNGHEYVEVDARGQELGPLREGGVELPVPGQDLRLTISDRLQRLAARLVAQYPRAAVVGLDVRTGDVLCLVSQPGFDPNIFLGTIEAGTWDSLINNPSKPFFNRAVTSTYPPGSTIKPLVALGALRSGRATPATRFQPCNGSYKYGNRVFRCTGSHGSLNLIEAITYSCNTYFYQLALALGLDSLTSYIGSVGLGRLTGIDLPGEKPGNVPTRAWLDARYGRNQWGWGSLLNFGIGQGEVLATPLQMAYTYAALANGGTACRPHVVERVDSAGRTVYQRPIERTFLPMRPADLASVKLAMERVVESGTGTQARLKEIAIAGKTGTSQNPPKPDHAWFVGYAPADAPEVVFAVLVENAGHGGVIAAPIAGRLIHAWFFPDEAPAHEPDSLAAGLDSLAPDTTPAETAP